MGSTYGKRRGFPDFDKFKSGLTYQDAYAMLWVDSENQDDWKRKSNGQILRILHRLKVEMYEQATGINVDRDSPTDTAPPGPQYPAGWDAVEAPPAAELGTLPYPTTAEALCFYGHDEEEPRYRLAA